MNLRYLRVPREKQIGELPKPFNLNLPFDKDWKKPGVLKALVVIETVPAGDIGNQSLLSPGRGRDLVLNTLKRAIKLTWRYYRKPTPSMESVDVPKTSRWRFGFVNFNNRRWFHLDQDAQERLITAASRRVLNYIRKIKPDVVIVFGETAGERLTDFGTSAVMNFGRMTKINGTDIPAVVTLDVVNTEPSRDHGEMGEGAVVKPNILGHAIRNIATGLLGVHPHSIADVKIRPRLVHDLDLVKKIVQRAIKAKAVSLDVETTSLDTSNVQLLTVQVGFSEKEGYIIPIYHPDNPWSNDELKRLRSMMRRWLGRHVHPWDTSRYIIGQNIGYDMRILTKWLGIRHWHIPVWDLMAGEHLLDENIKLLRRFGADSVYGLRQITAYYDSDYFQGAEFSKEDRGKIADVDLVEGAPVLDYMAADVQLPFAAHKEQIRRARYIEHLGGTYGKDYKRVMLAVMSSMVKVAMIMRYRGTQVDNEYLLEVMAGTEEFARLRKEKLAEFYALPEARKANAIVRRNMGLPSKGFFKGKSQRVLDIGKPEHRKVMFVDVAGLKPLKIGKSGLPSFDKKFIEEYESVDCVRVFKEYVEMQQLQSSFVAPFARLMERLPDNRHDVRIHPDFGTNHTWTGRSNSFKPSLQQIPEHKKTAAYVKRILIAKYGHLHYEVDYSQFEVRCLALLSRDKAMIEMLNRIHDVIMDYRINQTKEALERKKLEGDFHKSNYSFFTGVPIIEVDKEQRQANKGIIFGVVYGMGDESLGVATKRSTEEAAALRGKFYERFPGAEAYLNRQTELGQTELFTVSPLGRRRNLFAYLSTMRSLRGGQDRRAQNSEIQGLASDLCWKSADLFAYNLNACMTQLQPRLARSAFSKGGVNVLNDRYMPFGPNAIVHDSNKGEAEFRYLFLHMHLLEHSMTKGLIDLVEKMYDWRINVPLDVEVDIGADWSRKRTWNGGDNHLDEIVLRALDDHRDLYGNDAVPNPKRELRRMKLAYVKQKEHLDLDGRYPLPHPLPLAA